jgi:hypothetical protein
MFDSQDSCDVQFVVKGPGDVGETRLGAHRYVLCSRNPVFYRLLWTAKAGAEKKLKENDIPALAFREVIRFLYCEDANLTLSNVFYVLRGARKYQVTLLSTRCLHFINSSITDDKVCAILDNCLLFHEDELVQSCLRHIELNTLAVLQTPGFLEIRVETLIRIVACDMLNVPELELFNACIAWAHGRLRSQGQNSPSGWDLRRLLDPVLALIRFPTMTTSDFATFVVPLNILDDAETCNIYKYFTCPEKPVKRFLTTKRGRPPAPSIPDYQNHELPRHIYPELGEKCLHDGLSAMGLSPSAPDLLPGPAVDLDPPPKYDVIS